MKKKNIHLVNSINQIIKQKNLISVGQPILLTISGGQDSICLLFIFLQLKTQWKFSLGFVYCQHLWQLDSFYNISLLAKLAYLFKLPFYSSITLKKIDTEQKARNWRYKIFQKISYNYKYSIITTGHTATDRIETLFLQFIRGTSPKGLFSLNWVSNQFKEKIFFPKFSLILEECFFDCFLFIKVSKNPSWSNTFFNDSLLKYSLQNFYCLEPFSKNTLAAEKSNITYGTIRETTSPLGSRKVKHQRCCRKGTIFDGRELCSSQKNAKTRIFFNILIKKRKSKKNKIQKNFYINNLSFSLKKSFSGMNSQELDESNKIFSYKKNNSLTFSKKKILVIFSPQIDLLLNFTIKSVLSKHFRESRRLLIHDSNRVLLPPRGYHEDLLPLEMVMLDYHKNHVHKKTSAKSFVYIEHILISRISLKYFFVSKLKKSYYKCFLPWLIWGSLVLKKKHLNKKQHLLFIGFRRNNYRWKNEIEFLLSKSFAIKKRIPTFFLKKRILFTHYSLFSSFPLIKFAYHDYSCLLVSQAEICESSWATISDGITRFESKSKKKFCYLKNYTIRNFSSSLEIKRNKKWFKENKTISLYYDSKKIFTQKKMSSPLGSRRVEHQRFCRKGRELSSSQMLSSFTIKNLRILIQKESRMFSSDKLKQVYQQQKNLKNKKYSSKNYIAFWFLQNKFLNLPPKVVTEFSPLMVDPAGTKRKVSGINKSSSNFLIKKYRKIAKKFLTIAYWKKFQQNFSICQNSSLLYQTCSNETKLVSTVNNDTIKIFASTKFLVSLFFPPTAAFCSSRNSQNKILLIRPILILNRFDLKKLCEYWKVPIYPDKSNQKVKYYRNRIRKQLLPVLRFFFNPQIDTIILQFAEIVNVENFYFDFITDRLLKETNFQKNKNIYSLPLEMVMLYHTKWYHEEFNISLFQVFPLAIQRRLLKTILKTLRTKKIKFFHIEKFLKFIQQKKIEKCSLLKTKTLPLVRKPKFFTTKSINFASLNSFDSLELKILKNFYNSSWQPLGSPTISNDSQISINFLLFFNSQMFDPLPSWMRLLESLEMVGLSKGYHLKDRVPEDINFVSNPSSLDTIDDRLLESKINILSLINFKDKKNVNKNNFFYKKFYTQPECFFVSNLGIFFFSDKHFLFLEHF